MINTLQIVDSCSTDPWFNLALEEFLYSHLKEGEMILYLWQNNHTVVIGRNQNPWKECKLELLEIDNGKLARRSSGGGAVYHDLGNLNYTFITSKEDFNIARQMSIILKATQRFDIPSTLDGRNDVTVHGQKFSGNAYYYGFKNSLHHGTLLIDTKIDELTKYLTVDASKLKSKGVESVRSRVINLSTLSPIVTVENMKLSLIEEFIHTFNLPYTQLEYQEYLKTEEFTTLYDKYSSREFRLGHILSFDVTIQNRWQWGLIDLGFHIQDGKINYCKAYSDALEVDVFQRIPEVLMDIPFQSIYICNALERLKADGIAIEIIEDLQTYILESVL